MPPDLPPCSCTFRADPVHKGDKVVPPASFPAALPPDPNMIPDEPPTVEPPTVEPPTVEPPTVSEEVLEEVCRNPTSDNPLLISFL